VILTAPDRAPGGAGRGAGNSLESLPKQLGGSRFGHQQSIATVGYTEVN
jgi:hypothetical protein